METVNGLTESASGALFANLERETSLCREMVEMLEGERRALVAMDMEKLIASSITKKNLAVRIGRVDESLREAIRELAGEPSGPVLRLSSLEPVLSPDETARLREYRATLADLRFEIEDRNLVNRRFAEETLGYIGDAIRLITGTIAEHSSYESHGGLRKARQESTLISTEV